MVMAEPESELQHESRALACMEVWGGNCAFAGAVKVAGSRLEVSCRPHGGSTHGGDIYYASSCLAGSITRLILTDVSGHGPAVAGLAGRLRVMMRRHINTPDQTSMARALNGALTALELEGRFATAVLATYLAETDHLIVCNAGHPAPLLYRAQTGAWSLLDARAPGVRAATGDTAGIGIRNLPLGVIDQTHYEQLALRLEPGDRVVLYTDALIEAKVDGPRQLGADGLLRLAAEIPVGAEGWGVELKRRVAAAAGIETFDDDATVIVLHHDGSNPPVPTLTDLPRRIGGWLKLLGVDSEPGT
jgi:serine phosphatase RsbU (regulator of sigma subunit)